MSLTTQERIAALNEAAYAAARAARKDKDPRADDLKRIALDTDDLFELRPVFQSVRPAIARAV